MQYARINEEDILNVASGLETCRSATELSSMVHFDVSGLIKHIKKYRVLQISNLTNKCGNKYECHIAGLCPDCYSNKYTQSKKELLDKTT